MSKIADKIAREIEKVQNKILRCSKKSSEKRTQLETIKASFEKAFEFYNKACSDLDAYNMSYSNKKKVLEEEKPSETEVESK